MPKLKNYGPGHRYNLWVPERLIPTLEKIENHSKFFQMALEQAYGIMTLAILRERAPDEYTLTGNIEEVAGEYNRKFPLDPLTKQRHDSERIKRQHASNSAGANTELW